MAIVIGQALEQVAMATGATAHLYKNSEIGPQVGQCRLNVDSFDDTFAEIVRKSGVRGNSRQGSSGQLASAPA